MSCDAEYEPIPPLPWVDVAKRLRTLKQVSASPAAFVRAVQTVLDEMGYEVRRPRPQSRRKTSRKRAARV